MLHLLESLSKWMVIVSFSVLLFTYFSKDRLPAPDTYGLSEPLPPPLQEETLQTPFGLQVGGEHYRINPVQEYRLEGVIVSYHDADAFNDIWHHDKWKDFLNVRDLCVIWGENLHSGIYQEMTFKNDSWTCWAYWPDSQTGSRFAPSQISNNHILTDDIELKRTLLSAEIGDRIRLRGMLASYENPANGFRRGTSTIRNDMGNGACETIYLKGFEIVQKANEKSRMLFRIAKWSLIFSLCLFLILFFITPPKAHT